MKAAERLHHRRKRQRSRSSSQNVRFQTFMAEEPSKEPNTSMDADEGGRRRRGGDGEDGERNFLNLCKH